MAEETKETVEEAVEETIEVEYTDKELLHVNLSNIQAELTTNKSHYNKFSNFNYRTKEDILEALKPFLKKYKLTCICHDEVSVLSNGWVYIKTTATLYDLKGNSISAEGLAREDEAKKQFDSSQLTGSAASYAGKRALCNLFAIDDGIDADSQMPEVQSSKLPDGQLIAHCKNCGQGYTFPSLQAYQQFVASPGCCPNPQWVVD